MACDCNKKDYTCKGMSVSSNCVLYEGPSIPLLGVCKGDPVTYIVQAIADEFQSLLDEEQIALDSITLDNCGIVQSLLAGKDKTFANLIQVLITYQCTLTQLIEALQQQVDGEEEEPYAFDLKCITPVGTPVSVNGIIQGIINKVCALETTVNNLGSNVTEIVNDAVGNFIATAITANGGRGITVSGSGSTTKVNIYALVPPFTALPYIGPASNFDSNGVGIAGSAYDGWYFMNGQGGRLDARGRTLVAAVKNVQGPALDPAVDPTQPNNPSMDIQLGDKFGENYHKPTLNEMVPHSHSLVDPGHTHTMPGNTMYNEFPNEGGIGGSEDWAKINKNVGISTTGITIGSTGGGDIFNVRQPSLTITGYIYRID